MRPGSQPRSYLRCPATDASTLRTVLLSLQHCPGRRRSRRSYRESLSSPSRKRNSRVRRYRSGSVRDSDAEILVHAAHGHADADFHGKHESPHETSKWDPFVDVRVACRGVTFTRGGKNLRCDSYEEVSALALEFWEDCSLTPSHVPHSRSGRRQRGVYGFVST